jgi:curved DNA-binding protein
VVQVPKGVRDGQLIRLNGMGKEGTHGARSGDLLLKVKIRTPILKKIKDMLGLT